jgi:hypothetical protein
VVHDLALHGETPKSRSRTPDRSKSRLQRRNSVSVCQTPTRTTKPNVEQTVKTPKKTSKQIADQNVRNKQTETDKRQQLKQTSRVTR